MTMSRVGIIAIAISLLAYPARAASIGLLGGDYDPIPINDPTIRAFGACNGNSDGPSIDDEYFANYTCLFYHFADLTGDEFLDAVNSIEFLVSGFPPGYELFQNDPRSDLPFLTIGDTLVPGALGLSGGSIVPCFAEIGCDGGRVTGMALFIGPSCNDFEGDDCVGYETLPSSLSGNVVAVNGVVTVPEPASLLLLGPGALGALLSRRRNRAHQRA